jgi:integrase
MRKAFGSRPRHPVTGRRFWLRASSARELDAYLHRLDTLRTELRLGVRSAEEIDHELRHLRHGPVTLERACVSYLETRLAPNTKRGIRSWMRTHAAVLQGYSLSALDGPLVDGWIRDMERAGLEASSIGTSWRRLRAVCAHGVRRGWIAGAPWGLYKPKIARTGGRGPREAARTVEELAALLAAASAIDAEHDADPWPPMLEAKIACAGLLGMRQGELAGVRWNDVQLRGDSVDGVVTTVRIVRQWEDAIVKGKKVAELQTIAELGVILEHHRRRLERAHLFNVSGPIFPCRSRSAPDHPRAYLHGEVLTRLHLRAAVRRASLPNFASWSAHSLRDTFVTLEASASGGDLAGVQQRSRHSSVASLARYLRALNRNHLAPPAIASLTRQDAGDARPPLLGPQNDAPHK